MLAHVNLFLCGAWWQRKKKLLLLTHLLLLECCTLFWLVHEAIGLYLNLVFEVAVEWRNMLNVNVVVSLDVMQVRVQFCCLCCVL